MGRHKVVVPGLDPRDINQTMLARCVKQRCMLLGYSAQELSKAWGQTECLISQHVSRAKPVDVVWLATRLACSVADLLDMDRCLKAPLPDLLPRGAWIEKIRASMEKAATKAEEPPAALSDEELANVSLG